MSGRVPPIRKPRNNRGVSRASKIYEDFTGHDAEEIGVIDVPPIPTEVAVIGECDAISYTTIREGRTEHYIHEFAASDKPTFCISPDGRQILLIGGRFKFTNRGIVDDSDKKNQPGRRRR
jgi:hypothetical protein